MSDERIKVGVTLGDMNGIGPEIILKTIADSRMLQDIVLVIYGSGRVFNHYRKTLDMDIPQMFGIQNADEAVARKANLISITNGEVHPEPGRITREAGALAFRSLDRAVSDLAGTKIDVLVTSPINKKNIQNDDFHFAGHTEYLANYSNVDDALMFMCSDNLRVGVVTGHMPLKDVSSKITIESVREKIIAVDKSLRLDFSIEKPRIAVLGLNPHAGDNGLLGSEEKDHVIPAINEARDQGILAVGPFPADGFFAGGRMTEFDAVLAMYHDQGLIPFKALAGDYGVNFTARLPIVRTSPAHGTAYDIAGKGKANEQSFRQAIYMACDIYTRRKENKLLRSNVMETRTHTGRDE